MDSGIRPRNRFLQMTGHCCHWSRDRCHSHFEMMLNLNCCPAKASDLSSKWRCCRCNCRNRSAAPDRERFAPKLYSKRMTDAGTGADAIDANCWLSIGLRSAGPTGCHFRLEWNWRNLNKYSAFIVIVNGFAMVNRIMFSLTAPLLLFLFTCVEWRVSTAASRFTLNWLLHFSCFAISFDWHYEHDIATIDQCVSQCHTKVLPHSCGFVLTIHCSKFVLCAKVNCVLRSMT